MLGTADYYVFWLIPKTLSIIQACFWEPVRWTIRD